MQRKIGAHVSTAGGVELAFERASIIGCNCVQIFSGSPRVWVKKPLDQHNWAKIRSESQRYAVSPVFTHAIYLANLASDRPDLIQKSVQTLTYDLKFDALIGRGGVAVHLGSHQGRGWLAVRDQLIKLILGLLQSTPVGSRLLVENSAGQQGKVCSDLADIRWLLDEVELVWQSRSLEKNHGLMKNRLGWCFDTCHAFATGYYLGHKPPRLEGQSAMFEDRVVGSALQIITKLKLWSSLKMIHVNDSRDLFASGRDRHANLGEGKIDKRDLQYFLNYRQVKRIPLVLEVPGEGKKGPNKANVDRLKLWVGD
ncbi:MAG: deoxyribonuclease IV [Patescibacteria group bacterium]